ncbi:MAG: alkane 1-monooxygenase [Rhodobacterales bacterium]|nr:MAG: alkane 1-monooxygenase [Rhodobacterales bacterium]
MIGFALATLGNVVLLFLALWAGGVWIWIALAYITAFTALLDRFVPRLFPDMSEGEEFPSGAVLSMVLGVAHLLLLGCGVYVLSGDGPGVLPWLGLAVALALFFGQVSHPNAHELIHRREKGARILGRVIYSSLLFGHHASAHVLVHHVHVCSDQDPNSARRGVGFYRFFAKAWAGSFRAGLRAENALRARASRVRSVGSHPYLWYVGIAVGLICGSYALFGLRGLGTLLFIAFYAQVQILLADYVQHYGLRRRLRENGKPEPVGPGHSWNAPHWFSSALMVNAPRHSDHHLNPLRPYPGLRLNPETMPVLPHSLPVMAAIALWPPLWRRVMARCLKGLPVPGDAR